MISNLSITFKVIRQSDIEMSHFTKAKRDVRAMAQVTIHDFLKFAYFQILNEHFPNVFFQMKKFYVKVFRKNRFSDGVNELESC